MIDLGLFTTHPIQYQVPWFRALHETDGVDLTVYYDRLPNPEQQGVGFGQAFSWDLPLLEGYPWKVRDQRGVAPERCFSLPQAVAASDVVLVTGWNDRFLIAATLLSFVMRRPLIVRGESNALKPRSSLVQLLHRLYLSLFDEVLTIGNANASFYRENGVAEARLHPCRYFVENERFDRDYQELLPGRKQLRAAFDIPGEAICFLFSGKFIEKKRPLDLLRAFRRLSDLDSEVHLLMVGDGALLPEARAPAHGHELPITFTGFLNQSEIGKAYTAADVLVLPSDYDETWGLVVNEAMIFETPAIVSDRVGCGPDLVDDGATGYVFPFGDTDALADAMEKMARQPHQRRAMGRRARERVLADYSIEKAVEGTLQAVHAVHGGKHR